MYNMFLVAGTNSCAIINDGDDDFGETYVPYLTEESKHVLEFSSQQIDRSTLAHLKLKQQQELFIIINIHEFHRDASLETKLQGRYVSRITLQL